MKPVADASFLVAAFATADGHNRAAWRWWSKRGCAIHATRLSLFEAENTIRGFPLSGKCSTEEALRWINGIHRAILEGLIERRDAPLHRVLPLAHRLSLHHTMQATFGAMDILHVAAALDLKATEFLSFDGRQCELAEKEGLLTLP